MYSHLLKEGSDDLNMEERLNHRDISNREPGELDMNHLTMYNGSRIIRRLPLYLL